MIPLELKFDKEGLLYYDNPNLIYNYPLDIGGLHFENEKYFNYAFYELPSTSDYIVKYCSTVYTKSQIKSIKEMLKVFGLAQDKVNSVDFPIGYYLLDKILAGLIIRNYPNSPSMDKLIANRNINYLNKYYYHDDDCIHNLFIFFNEVLNSLINMYQNNIIYFDINPGNIVLFNNQVKIIDFDYRFIKFDKKYENIKYLYENYILFVKLVLESYNLDDNINGYYSNFCETKEYIKKLEKNVYRG